MSDQLKAVQDILLEAVEISDPGERAAFLSRACGADLALRREVEELLQAEAEAGPFLPDAPGTHAAQAALAGAAEALAPPLGPLQVPLTEKPGDHIGHYKLLQKIGEGGCGVVYMAEQEEPVRRKVALKVIKVGMDTKCVVARFEAERQALALMDHPNIAKVLDAGATGTGRPFFVMELVRGIKITDYCDQNQLTIRERLELFIRVCQAVQHAHQKGIIHRDLKPSNILVTVNDGLPVPKVIDFGIAKATEGRLTDQTLFTAFEQFLGTPAYMSPEQAAMTSLDIDTRSDIYSLGVLLYELLTGKTPFDTQALLASGLDELRRTIRETEPVRPSTRLTMDLGAADARPGSKSAVRGPRSAPDRAASPRLAPEQRDLVNLIRGDLDSIVMKCLEKDRARRYETANGLARDVQRHLDCEPVLARPPSRLYEFQKTVRRHKMGFAATAAVILALAGGVLVSSWEAVQARHAEREQSRLRDEAVQGGKRAQQAQIREAEQRQQAQRIVVGQYVANGTRLMNDGDLFGSLLWYAEALRLDGGDPRREAPHRIRIASVLRQCPELLGVFSHGTMLYHAEFSPDGSKVLTASDDHTARVWDATTGRELLRLRHDGEVYDAAFSPDGLRIVTSSRDKTARVWDSQTGALLRSLPHRDTVWGSCFSPDGRLVATACEDHTAQLWNVLTGERVGERLPHADRVDGLRFSPDGQLLATTTEGPANLWDVATGRRRFQAPHEGGQVSFSPDSRRFLTCENSLVHVWDSRTLAETSFSPLRLNGLINTVSFSPDGRTIVAGGNDFTARVWDASTGQPLFSQPVQHAGEVLDARISPDGRRFVTGGQDTVAQIWSTRTGQPVGPPLKHILHVKYLRFNPDGRRLLANSCDQAARVWDMATGGAPGPPRPALANERQLISPNGQYVLLQGASNLVWIVEARSGRRLAALPHPNPVAYASFSRDGRSVITACQEDNAVSSMKNDIFLWEAPTGRRLNAVPMAQPFRLLYVAFSPDSSRLLTCGFDYTARLWDAHTGQPLSPPLPHRQRIGWGAFSPDGHSVVTVSWDRTARVWDAATGNPLTPPLQHKTTVTGAFWQADGKRLCTITGDNHLQVWDLITGEPLTPPQMIQDPAKQSPQSGAPASAQASDDLPRDDRPVADLVLLARMLAVGKIDDRGNLVPLQLHELTSAWQQLHEKYPSDFATSPGQVAAWHRREAEESAAEGNLAAALFHFDHALAARPQDPMLTQSRSELAAALVRGIGEPATRASGSRSIPPRDPRAGAGEIDLSRYYNLGLRDSLTQQPGGDNFAELPDGLQTFAGVRFDVRGLVHLNGQAPKRMGRIFPARECGIVIGRKCQRLHFLQATVWDSPIGAQVGTYVLNYADRQRVELPICFGRDLANFWFWGAPMGPKDPGGAVPAWTGHACRASEAFASICLYKSTRMNPRPDVEVVSIDFVSAMSEAAPFLVGLTVD